MATDEPIPIKLRGKYRQQQTIKQNKYSARTGPHCCNGNCGRKVRGGVSWRKGTGGGSTARKTGLR